MRQTSGWEPRTFRQRVTRAVVALGVVASVAAASSTLAPTAGADGLIPTTTTVTASPGTSTAGSPVTLTATVQLLGILPGLGILPTGPVAFSATNGTTTTPLGTANLGRCLLTACTASITTTAIPAGSTSVTASYAGDTLSAASSGATAVTVTAAPPPPPPPPPPDVETTKVCTTGKTCSTATITSSDGLTSLQVTATGGAQSVYAALYDEGTLHCPGRDDTPPGSLAEFDNTSPTGTKTVTYRLDGTAARDMKIAYNQHPTYLGCYGSPTPFNGFTNGVYGPATFNAQDGLYVAQLATCTASGGQKPCFEWQSNYNFDSNAGTSKLTIFTPSGDPKFI